MSAISFADESIRKCIRPMARFINQVSKGKLTPDQVTITGVLMHLPLALFIAGGEFYWAALFLVVFGLFDTLDGELARLQQSASSKGMLLDATTDRIKETLIYGGVAYWLANNGHQHWVWLPVLACGVSITVSYAKAKGEAALALTGRFKDHHSLNRHFKEGILPFGVRMAIILIGLVSHQILIATGLIAVLATFTIWERLSAVFKQL